jgi:hypothetical protein
MTPVQWETPQVKAVYEDMVAVLLSSLHPEAERLDGSGGDGGRDLQLRQDGRLDLFELKSFTGRLGSAQGRRAQVQRSLEKAAAHNPDSWTLVVPIDHTEGELAWFDGLRRRYRFPLTWRGRTWLNQQLATHPAVVRYFLEDGDSHVVRVLRELQQEQAALAGGIPDALQRLQVLRQRIDELSPHYRLDIAIAGDTITVALRPRYRGAERDYPILVAGSFFFPDTSTGREAAQRLERALDFGEEVVVEPEHVRDLRVDLPGRLGEGITNPKIILGPAAEDPAFRLDGRATISDPAGAPLGVADAAVRPAPSRPPGRRALRPGLHRHHAPAGAGRHGHPQGQHRLPTRRTCRGAAAGRATADPAGAAALPRPEPAGAADRRRPRTPAADPAAPGRAGDRRLPGPGRGPGAGPGGLPGGVPAAEGAHPRGHGGHPPRRPADRRRARRHRHHRPATFAIVLRDPQFFEKLVVDDTPVSFTFTEGNYTETIAGVEVPLGPAFATLSSATVANRAELLATRPWHADQQLPVAVQPSPGVQLEVLLTRSGNGDSA